MEEEKIYFNAGDVVQLRLDISYKPKMLVVKKEAYIFKHDRKEEDKRPILKGIRCRWFTSTGELLEAVFNTKDLQKLND